MVMAYLRRALRLAPLISTLRFMMNPNSNVWTYGFEREYQFPKEIVPNIPLLQDLEGLKSHSQKDGSCLQ